MKGIVAAVLLYIPSLIFASTIEVYQFNDPDQEALYQSLIVELRCLVCQNQSIAESNAELAQDMRRKTYELIIAGKSEREIMDFMAERYGDFMLYRPPMKPMTWLLWFGPAIVLIVGFVFAVRFIRRQDKTQEAESLSEHDLERLKNLQAESTASNQSGVKKQ